MERNTQLENLRELQVDIFLVVDSKLRWKRIIRLKSVEFMIFIKMIERNGCFMVFTHFTINPLILIVDRYCLISSY